MISVLISTKNRASELKKALDSLYSQSVIPEVIVINDGSTDNTAMIVKESFPQVVLISHEVSRGLIVRRNEGVKAASNSFVLSIDDDCILESSSIIEDIVSFIKRTNCKAIAWPFKDVYQSTVIQHLAPVGENWQVHSFRGCSFVVEREIFLSLGGFTELFIHQGEEEDYCIRLLNAGYPVLLGDGNHISHFESPKRSWARMDFYGSRNLILFALFNAPSPYNFILALGSSVKSVIFGFRIRRPYQKTRGVLWGWVDAFKYLRRNRKPVSVNAYKLFRSLKSGGPRPVNPIRRSDQQQYT